MAAGLSLPEENIGLLRRELNEQCTLTEEDFVEKVKIDVPMPVSYVTENLIEQLSLLEPFGKANPKPAFAEKESSARIPGFSAQIRTWSKRGYSLHQADPVLIL